MVVYGSVFIPFALRVFRTPSNPVLLALCIVASIRGQSQPVFSNPLFAGQDPWVTQWNGNYYYSESSGGSILIRKSATLTGLRRPTPQAVWSPRSAGIAGMTNVCAPEIHFLNDRW